MSSTLSLRKSAHPVRRSQYEGASWYDRYRKAFFKGGVKRWHWYGILVGNCYALPVSYWGAALIGSCMSKGKHLRFYKLWLAGYFVAPGRSKHWFDFETCLCFNWRLFCFPFLWWFYDSRQNLICQSLFPFLIMFFQYCRIVSFNSEYSRTIQQLSRPILRKHRPRNSFAAEDAGLGTNRCHLIPMPPYSSGKSLE